MKIHKDFREASRKSWGVTVEQGEGLSIDQLQTGALLRIADAVEKVAADHDRLRKELEHQTDRATIAFQHLEISQRSNRALRGYLKRLKRKAAP